MLTCHFVINIILVRKQQFLLEKKLDSNWRLPGGHIEGGEDLLEAIRREAKEELGITVQVIGDNPVGRKNKIVCSLPIPISIYREIVNKDSRLNQKHLHVGLNYIVTTNEEPQSKEGQTIHWFTLDDLREGRVIKPIQALCVQAKELELHYLAGRKYLY